MKANIVQIGKVINRNPVNWSFDSYTNIPALSMSGKGILYYGYTVEELNQLSAISYQLSADQDWGNFLKASE